eukprot:scaffold2376_cov16-Tisochrysis_lutea.AAC.2
MAAMAGNRVCLLLLERAGILQLPGQSKKVCCDWMRGARRQQGYRIKGVCCNVMPSRHTSEQLVVVVAKKARV